MSQRYLNKWSTEAGLAPVIPRLIRLVRLESDVVLASGAAGEMTTGEALAATPVAASAIRIGIPLLDPVAEIVIACFVPDGDHPSGTTAL